MKKFFLSLILFFILILFSLIVILSTIGYETTRFNKIISNKIGKSNQNISLKLEKIKFRFDIKNLGLFLNTQNPELTYLNLNIPIETIKVYLNIVSLIKSNPKIEKLEVKSKEIDLIQLKKILMKTKPSNLNSLINNKIKRGKLITNLELYFDSDFGVENFIAKGEVKKVSADLYKNLILQDVKFNFFADNSDVLIKNIEGKMNGISLKEGSLQIDKNKNIKINSNFVTNLNLNKKNIFSYLSFFKNIKYINKNTNFEALLNHNLNITFDKTFKVINYSYKNTGKVNNAIFKLNKPIQNVIFDEGIYNFNIKNSDLNFAYNSDKKNHIHISGSYQINNFDYQNFNIKNNFSKNISNIETDFQFKKKLKIDLINYEKDKEKTAKVSTNFRLSKNSIDFNIINYVENKNLISIENLKINNNNIISFKKIKVKTYKDNDLKNDFVLNLKKELNVKGEKYDATNLNKIINKKSNNNPLKKISKNIDIDLKNIETSLSKKLTNFKLIGVIEKGKFIKISSKGDFGDNKFLDISLKNNKNDKKKYLEIYSDLPQPLLSDYSFFKGLVDGKLTFSSIIDVDSSNSKLVIENFKIVNAPGVVKLLSLADFGGLADLAEGEGLSFEKLEIKMSNSKGLVKLEELYAVGPSISVLMDGYKDITGLTSLRGTLVPAKNLNKLISKIPVIGNIIIPKEVGEGLFGVSFKMKGPPGKIKTTINPIKTLTPRFITKALEKSKKSK
jgi:hypothetical protein